jgi:hypothetical protein
VKLHALAQFDQARRQTRRNKMNEMPAFGEFAPQFRTDNSAAAVRWINRDSDVH